MKVMQIYVVWFRRGGGPWMPESPTFDREEANETRRQAELLGMQATTRTTTIAAPLNGAPHDLQEPRDGY